MSDLFHEEVSVKFIQQVFDTMRRAYWHTFQILTKRSERLVRLAPSLAWPPNVWMGVSVENSDVVERIDHLRKVSSAVRFLSLEPLLGPLPDLNLREIHWVIVGGESGPGARLMEPSWASNIKQQCESSHVPFFFKQWGGVFKKRNGRKLEGKTWDELPQPRVLAVS